MYLRYVSPKSGLKQHGLFVLYVLALFLFCATSANGSELSVTYFNLGVNCATKGDYNRAIENLNQAIRLDPKLAMACLIRSIWYSDPVISDRRIRQHPTRKSGTIRAKPGTSLKNIIAGK